MTRTDIHRPSAINPDDYDFVACDYFGQWGSVMMLQDRLAYQRHRERTGGLVADKHNSGSCHICGAGALYVARYHHRPTNTYIVTGMDCAVKIDIGDADLFKSFRKSVHNQREKLKGKHRAKETLALLGLSDAWKYYEYGYDDGWRKEEPIIMSVVDKLVRYGNMSEKQATLIQDLLRRIAGRAAADAERAARQAAQAAISNYVGTVGERIDLDLIIDFITSFDTQFGTMVVHSMHDAAGNVVVYKGSNRIGQKGESIKMKATIKAHSKYKGTKQTQVARPKVAA